jgi:glutamate-ammonia-ligase adenylyltransferase
MTPQHASAALSAIADVVIQAIIPIVWTEFKQKFGTVENGSLAVLAYGKLGSGELMPTSDLDLVIVYDAPHNASATGTDRSLPASAYFIRLAQRIVSTLTAMTSEGRLYEIDLRLRPSGDQGPFATSCESFEKYQLSDAWIWEHLALTKARIVFSTDEMDKKLRKVISRVLSRPKNRIEISNAIAEMRKRIAAEHSAVNHWDIKRMNGGLADTEFLIQLHSLASGLCGDEKWPSSTLDVLDYLIDTGHLNPDEGLMLKKAFELWLNTLWLLRLSLDHSSSISDVPIGLQERIARVSNIGNPDRLKKVILDTRQQISELVERDIRRS